MSTETTTRGLSAEQLELLLRSLSPNRVRQHQGNAHLEAWDVRKWLTRIFGFAGWDDDILSCECVHSVTTPVMDNGKPHPLKHRCTAVYRVTLRLTVKDQWGNVLGHWDDGATGEGVNQTSVGDAHDLALKAALSQALKRCAVNLGDQFGLSLYNKGDLSGVVVRTLGHPALAAPADAPEDAPVVGGELDEQREAPLTPQDAADAVAHKAAREAPARDQVHRSGPAAQTAPDAWTGGEGTALPPAARPASKAQVQKVNILVGQKRGNLPRPARLLVVSSLTGRALSSANDLTAAEAHRVIEALAAEADLVPDDGQDFHLAPSVGPEPLCADLEATIAECTDVPELEAVAVRIGDCVKSGALHATHRERLLKVWAERRGAVAGGGEAGAEERPGWSHRRLAETTGAVL